MDIIKNKSWKEINLWSPKIIVNIRTAKGNLNLHIRNVDVFNAPGFFTIAMTKADKQCISGIFSHNIVYSSILYHGSFNKFQCNGRPEGVGNPDILLISKSVDDVRIYYR